MFEINSDFDWGDVRELFPVCENYVYFQTAAVTALSLPAREAMSEFVREMAEDGCLNEDRWMRSVESIRTKAARLINVPPSRVGFVKNTSHGLSIIANSLRLEPGDGIAVPEGEFPANVYPWMNVAEQENLDFQRIPTGDQGEVTLNHIQAGCGDNTRVLSLSSVQFHNGFRADLEAIGSFCHTENIHFVVDGIQSIGWDNLDCHGTPIDAIVADGHKWMCGPEGIGIIYLSEPFQSQLSMSNVGWKSVKNPFDFSQWDFNLRDEADVVEEGSSNTVGIMGLGASLELLLDLGLDLIKPRTLHLRDKAARRLANAGFDLPSSDWEESHRSPILSINHPNLDMESLHQKCLEENIQASVRGGRLRLSFHFYNNETDIDTFLNVSKQCL